ncbi:fumarylacetoacetate hydrolase family protein [uncultured Polaribacter sp.]|uniref:fumarylacetoacetate hydrolase family protein n=1 Tax=uncultured Polaribacter sp. TaxID=174711 RepID=UPI002610456B|nr:fumarylacetoacetate hydrolase family protein [uncultured Polaribacter sp.]
MKILGIGKNYVINLDDIKANKENPKLIFSKPESSLSVNRDIDYPSITNQLVYEVELVIKIGKEGKNIPVAEANSYISEIAVGIDYTAKDVLNEARSHKHAWDLAKGFDGAAPISTFKSINDFTDLSNINFSLKINNQQVQAGNTGHMIHNFAEIISYVSAYMTLQPGDLIFTGTPPEGIGENKKGDHLQCFVEEELWLDFKIN